MDERKLVGIHPFLYHTIVELIQLCVFFVIVCLGVFLLIWRNFFSRLLHACTNYYEQLPILILPAVQLHAVDSPLWTKTPNNSLYSVQAVHTCFNQRSNICTYGVCGHT